MLTMITKLLEELDVQVEGSSDYFYNGVRVPRVTSILNKCIHNDSLMYWANSLGFKHKSYKKTLDASAEIGTQCHNSIESFLMDNSFTPDHIHTQANNAYKSFLRWFNDIRLMSNVEVIFHEKTLTCPYFGGTLDGLYRIDDKIYLVDYKTSNQITYKHFLQLAAYKYMLRTVLGIEVDGCIVLQVSKHDIEYNEYSLIFNNPQSIKFINDCEYTFLSLVHSYYNIIRIENTYKTILGGMGGGCF